MIIYRIKNILYTVYSIYKNKFIQYTVYIEYINFFMLANSLSLFSIFMKNNIEKKNNNYFIFLSMKFNFRKRQRKINRNNYIFCIQYIYI